MARFVPTPRRLAAIVITVVVVGLAGYLVVTALLARRELNNARSALSVVKSRLLAGDEAGARAELATAEHDAAAAAGHTGGPVWRAAAAVPVLGSPLDTVRGIAATAHDLTSTTLPRVVDVATALSPDRLRVAPDRIDVGRLRGAAPTLSDVARATAAAGSRADALPHHTWLPPADTARRQFADLVDGLARTLSRAAQASRLLPPMLGENGTRRYFLAIQTNAESRGLGGLPGVFAILRARNGRVGFERFGNDSDITAQADVDLGRDFAHWYGQLGAQKLFVNSTASPDMPSVARIWMSMWQHQSGERLDGAVATDPVALSYLLKVTGPLTLPDHTVVSGDTIVKLAESEAYSRFRSTPRRKKFFVELGRATADHVLHGAGGHGTAVLEALQRAADERRLLVWSAHRDEESQLAATVLGGVLPTGPAPMAAFDVNNAAGNKLDYYLDRTFTYAPGACSAGRRSSTATVTLHNDAPTHGLPPYVVIRSDHPTWPPPPGTTREFITVYTTDGTRLVKATMNGTDVTDQIVSGREKGHPLFAYDVDIKPQSSVTLQLALSEPRAGGQVRTFHQPLVRPLQQTIGEPAC
ncbi:MAG TPA: DUF4012 domain-containing protein [Mycobacteriales bacterium]|nr:DUF4012 domain-containing protein [Mycobacteriales bacterium]